MNFFRWLTDTLQRVKFWTIVQPWEAGVRVRLGRRVTRLEPGFHWRVPLIDIVTTINTRLRIAAFPTLTVATRNGKPVSVAGSIGFRISDPYEAMMATSAPESTVAAYVQGAAARYIASRNSDGISVEDFEAAMLGRLDSQAAWASIDFVNVVDFAVVRALRLLQEQWRPGTGHETFDDVTK